MTRRLTGMYKRLYASFGPQHWWPARTPFEVMVGAILTQNTSWKNVEKAIANLKRERKLSPRRLYGLKHQGLARLIRPAGYFNVKARRLRAFCAFFLSCYRGSVKRMSAVPMARLREELLSVHGIGPETADSILLYALNKPAFVIDAYTKRVLSRHRLVRDEVTYEKAQKLFTGNLTPCARIFNEYHALIVKLGKEYCRPRDPRCDVCPLGNAESLPRPDKGSRT